MVRYTLQCQKCGGVGTKIYKGVGCECGGTFVKKPFKIQERPKNFPVKNKNPGIRLKKRKVATKRL